MKHMYSLIAVLIFSSITIAQTAQEAVELMDNEQGFGIRAAGMGNAYTAVADDYSAVYWNPAGLAQLDYGHMSGSLYHNTFDNDASYFGSRFADSRTFTKLQSLGFAYPFPVARGSFVVAFGYQKVNNLDSFSEVGGFINRPNNLNFDYGDGEVIDFNNNVDQNYSIYRDGGIDHWSFAAAMDLSPNFSAGLTLNFYGGSSTYMLDFLQTDVNDVYRLDTQLGYDFESYAYNQRILSDFSGFEAKLGGLFHLSPNLRLGTVITFPVSMTINEEWSEDDVIAYDDPSVPLDEYDYGSKEFDYELDIPIKFSAGLSYSTERLTLTSSFDYRDWSQLKFDVPSNRNPGDYDDLLSENATIRDNFRGVLSYALGGEFKVFKTGLMIRAGFKNMPTAQKNLSSDYDKQFYSFGLGYSVDKRTTIDFSYTQGEWNRDFNYVFSSDVASETIQSQTVLFGLNYRF